MEINLCGSVTRPFGRLNQRTSSRRPRPRPRRQPPRAERDAASGEGHREHREERHHQGRSERQRRPDDRRPGRGQDRAPPERADHRPERARSRRRSSPRPSSCRAKCTATSRPPSVSTFATTARWTATCRRRASRLPTARTSAAASTCRSRAGRPRPRREGRDAKAAEHRPAVAAHRSRRRCPSRRPGHPPRRTGPVTRPGRAASSPRWPASSSGARESRRRPGGSRCPRRRPSRSSPRRRSCRSCSRSCRISRRRCSWISAPVVGANSRSSATGSAARFIVEDLFADCRNARASGTAGEGLAAALAAATERARAGLGRRHPLLGSVRLSRSANRPGARGAVDRPAQAGRRRSTGSSARRRPS